MADVQFNLGDDQYLPQNRLDDLPSAILDTAFFLSGSDHSYLSNGFDQYNEWVDGGLEYLLNGFQYENVNDGSQQMPCLVQDNEVPLESKLILRSKSLY